MKKIIVIAAALLALPLVSQAREFDQPIGCSVYQSSVSVFTTTKDTDAARELFGPGAAKFAGEYTDQVLSERGIFRSGTVAGQNGCYVIVHLGVGKFVTSDKTTVFVLTQSWTVVHAYSDAPATIRLFESGISFGGAQEVIGYFKQNTREIIGRIK